MGVPYVATFGAPIDQPPLGFYTEAEFYQVFGSTEATSVVLVTAFGLDSTLLVYFLGRKFYGSSAGLVAAALFGLNPWHLVLSRSALIDLQCLFLSLLALIVGVWAIRKTTVKPMLLAGALFAAAFMTKFYAAFVLIPLLLFYLYSHPKTTWRVALQVAAFSLPSIAAGFVWYQLVLGRSLLLIFRHNDSLDVIPQSVHVAASPFFASNFLLNYGLGAFFLAAVGFSLAISFWLRKKHPYTALSDFTWAFSAVAIVGVNVFLGYVFKSKRSLF